MAGGRARNCTRGESEQQLIPTANVRSLLLLLLLLVVHRETCETDVFMPNVQLLRYHYSTCARDQSRLRLARMDVELWRQNVVEYGIRCNRHSFECRGYWSGSIDYRGWDVYEVWVVKWKFPKIHLFTRKFPVRECRRHLGGFWYIEKILY